jgi:hypothetical protein
MLFAGEITLELFYYVIGRVRLYFSLEFTGRTPVGVPP